MIRERRLREKCTSFAVDCVLMHRGQKGKLCRVIIDPTEKDRIAASLHADVVGATVERTIRMIRLKILD